jgi:GT2 family glycosyltransferase/tetratricopeptide (TPR) repeat protein
VVILAWNAWEHTKRCLDSLRPTLRLGDHVVVVDNGSTDATPTELLGYSWIEVVSNPVNVGFAPGCNQGASYAKGEVLVFLNNDTVVAEGWLDALLAPFVDDSVGAVGPRSNNVSGVQVVEGVPYHQDDLESIKEFANSWQTTHASMTTECVRLVGFCLAVRSSAFHAVEGFDEGYVIGSYEDDDLCMKLRSQKLRLLIAHGSFVHHVSHATFDANGIEWERQETENQRRFLAKWSTKPVPQRCLLSVCLIVKDEEELLASCLESIVGLADEVVVYDTGSIDRTIEIARSSGAKVIEGYWDDNFARARNSVLAEARGDWVLSLDADERFLSDPKSLRKLLEDEQSNVEAYLVAIENLHGAGNARSVHTAVRLFRRTSCTWIHRLHEQIVAADSHGRNLRVAYLSGARIIHHGYAAEVFDAKNKSERNLALAEAALGDDDLNPSYALMNFGRALESAGRSEEAVEALAKVASMETDPTTKRLAVKNLIYILGRLARFDDALVQVKVLRDMSMSQMAADVAEGTLRISMGEAQTGLTLLARVPERGRDDDGMEYSAHMLSAMRADAMASLGRHGEAADVVLETIRNAGVLEADLGELTRWLTEAQRPLTEIADALDVDDLLPILGRVLRQTPIVADEILEGVWSKFPDQIEPLAAASRVAPRLGVARALVWSARLRGRGLAASCPLIAIANNVALDPKVRILAGSAAYGSFGERAVVNAVHEARSRLTPAALLQSTLEIGKLAPGLLQATHVEAEVITQTEQSMNSRRLERSRPRSMTSTLPVAAPVASFARRGGVNIVGPFESIDVQGIISRTLTRTLRSHGLTVSTTTYRSDGRNEPVQWQHLDAGDHPFDTTLLVMAPSELTNFVVENGAAAFENRYIVGVWLCDYERPSEIMSTTAQMVHEIWVPSDFSARAIAQVTTNRITRVPVATMAEFSDGLTVDLGKGFSFLASVDYEAGYERQNPEGVISAFRLAFQPGEGPRLFVSAAHADHYPQEHGRLLNLAAGRSDVTVLKDDLTGPGRLLLEHGAGDSCFVSLHRSEGTGLLLALAMNRGIPTIVTRHSFSAEFQGERDSFQIPYVSQPVPWSERSCLPGGQWAEPDLDEAAKAMRLVVDQPKLASLKARRAKVRDRRQFAASQSAKVMKDRMIDIEQRRHGDTRSMLDSSRMSAAGSR